MARRRHLALLLAALLSLPCSAQSEAFDLRAPHAVAGLEGMRNLLNVETCLRKAGNYKIFLNHLRTTGLKDVLHRLVATHPVTIMAPTDAAFRRLPRRIQTLVHGPRLLKLVQYHLLLHHLSAAYLDEAASTAFFGTVHGDVLFKAQLSDPSSGKLAFAATSPARPGRVAAVMAPDLCGGNTPLIAVQGINNVLWPEKLFGAAS